jgi:hypothetical protein
MRPVGYIVMRHSVTAGRPARAYSRWIARMPVQYREYVLDRPDDKLGDVATDPNCLAVLKDYRSLMPMAQTNVSVAAGGWRIWRLPASGTELFLGFQGVERSNHGAMRLASCTAWSVGFGLKSRSGKFMRDYPSVS